MLAARVFVEAAKSRGFHLWTGVPCSYLLPFINNVINDSLLHYVSASNEGDAVAIAAGVELGGGRAVTMLQNSGLGNAVNPLTSLSFTHRIPFLLIVTLRGEPGGPTDEPQHELMGSITANLLDLMQIRSEYFPTREEDVEPCLDRAVSYMERERLPYCLMMRKDTIDPYAGSELHTRLQVPERRSPRSACSTTRHPHASRAEMLVMAQGAIGQRDLALSTTGYTSRELYAQIDRPNQLYLVGAMGCASSVGLGLALRCQSLRVIVFDGDGAALMRLGAMAAIGHERPANLLHVVLDNGVYESTGGQATVARSVDFAAIAAACGYPQTLVVFEPEELRELVAMNSRQLTFVRAMIAPGTMKNLPRPKNSPTELTERFRSHIRALVRAE
jgi:phosphonopyruvate decarboxylase